VGTRRASEQFRLELVDLRRWRGTTTIVRYGSRGKPPKNSKIRRAPLAGLSLAASPMAQLLPDAKVPGTRLPR
jgi:hypothetical protein